MDKNELLTFTSLIALMVIVGGGLTLAGLSDEERNNFCVDLGYDGYNTVKNIEEESWIECVKSKIVNQTLIEYNDWFRWNK